MIKIYYKENVYVIDELNNSIDDIMSRVKTIYNTTRSYNKMEISDDSKSELVKMIRKSKIDFVTNKKVYEIEIDLNNSEHEY
jgi:hypothetical protein